MFERKYTHSPGLSIVLKILALDAVPLALHETEFLFGKLNLESTRFIDGAVGGGVCESIWLVQCPEVLEGDQARLQHRVQCLLGSSIILVQVLEKDFKVLSLGLIALDGLLLALLDSDLLILELLGKLAKVLEVEEEKIRVDTRCFFNKTDTLDAIHNISKSFFNELALDVNDSRLGRKSAINLGINLFIA